MACAASRNGWYAWISPWLLGESEDQQHLIPLGDSYVPRVVVGHNVSYDRARVKEEYNLAGTGTRWLDTMALHVAVKGISSHQRPAWMKYRKSKVKEREQKEEAYEVIVELLREMDSRPEQEVGAKREEMLKLKQALEEGLPQLLEGAEEEEEEADVSSKRWEDITSANSLADVAKLHCDIEVDKGIRNDFMTHSPADILANVQDYLNYCAQDVAVTHAVYAKVLPAFLVACPSPVSFAGILSMGSSFLTVNEEWEKYLENAERTYRELEDKVKKRLTDLAYEAKDLMRGDRWKDDVWLSQFDWTPKVANKSRGILYGEQVWKSLCLSCPFDLSFLVLGQTSDPPVSTAGQQPAWYAELLACEPFKTSAVNRILPLLLKVTFDGQPLQYSTSDRWHFVVDGQIEHLPSAGKAKLTSILGRSHGLPYLKSGRLSADDVDLATAIASGDKDSATWDRVLDLAARVAQSVHFASVQDDPWLKQLDWEAVDPNTVLSSSSKKALPKVIWPKWFWDLTRPRKDAPPGTVDLTSRSRVAPLLLHLSWQGWPLFHSRQHGWTFRVLKSANHTTRQVPLDFHDAADDALQNMSHHEGYIFYKLPHKDGESANVGSPLGKTFIKFAQDGTLTSPGDEAKSALDMNAQCSYWISARDRVLKQMVVWQQQALDMGFAGLDTDAAASGKKWGMIIPQVITMGTVTRRAIEKTWLTASNAKKNRV
ncbi:hypothetical protein EWM64_g5396, partial [Hericium alpestre]